MPTSYGGRMSKRLSQAPRLSVIMAGDDVVERKTSVREFICDHVKTIATLVMIVATIICIVLIVMVHKWQFETEQAQRIDACVDVAVVGSGLSGAYAAWRLRHTQQQVVLVEMTDRVGGRMYTWRPGAKAHPSVHGELGALFYLPQQHPLLNRSIHALKLTPNELRQPNHDHPMLFLRGTLMKMNLDRLTSSFGGPKYHLPSHEQGMSPNKLRDYYLEKILANDSDVHKSALHTYDKDGHYIYTQGYRNLLSRVASYEGLHLMSDAAPWRSFVSNGNAALLSSILLTDTHWTVGEGMDAVPYGFVEEFLKASSMHALQKNRRLGCISKERGYYDMIFIHTETKDDNTIDMRESTAMCAKNIILALPPPALRDVEWKKFSPDKNDKNDEEAKLLHERLDSIKSVPMVVAYFEYTKCWWEGNKEEPWRQDVTTDLPIKRVRYLGRIRGQPDIRGEDEARPEYDTNTERHLFMVANLDDVDYEYFSTLLSTTVYDGFLKVTCNKSDNFIKDITRQLSIIYKVKQQDIPAPKSLIIKNWAKVGGGRFMWKTGVFWERLAAELQRPRDSEEIFVVGDAYCPGQCQLWAEGALQTVDTMLTNYADILVKNLVKDHR